MLVNDVIADVTAPHAPLIPFAIQFTMLEPIEVTLPIARLIALYTPENEIGRASCRERV